MRDRTFIGFNCEELYLAKNQFNSIRLDESLAFVIDQGAGITFSTGTSLDGVPICKLVSDGAIS